jgi:hypothetical protein
MFRLGGSKLPEPANSDHACIPELAIRLTGIRSLSHGREARLTKVPHMSRPTGGPDFDRFLTNPVLTNFGEPGKRANPMGQSVSSN